MNRLKYGDAFLYAFFYATSLIFIFNTGEFEGDAAVYPRAVATVVIFFTTILLYRDLMVKTKESKKDDTVAKKLYISSLFSILYVGLVSLIGYFAATPVFMVALTRALGYRKVKTVILICVVLELVIYFAFKVALGVPIPGGLLLGDY